MFKYVLKRSTMEYFVWYLKKTLACMGVMLITWTGCHMVKTNILAELIIDFIICLLVTNICFWLLYHKNEDYKYCISLVKNVADKMFRRFMKGKK